MRVKLHVTSIFQMRKQPRFSVFWPRSQSHSVSDMAPGSELGHAAPKARALSVFLWAALVREDSAFTVRWGCHWVLRFQQGRASCWAALCVLWPTENLSSFVPGQANSGLLTASRGFFPLASSFLCIRQTLEEDAPPLDVLRHVSSLLRWLQRGPWSAGGWEAHTSAPAVVCPLVTVYTKFTTSHSCFPRKLFWENDFY